LAVLYRRVIIKFDLYITVEIALKDLSHYDERPVANILVNPKGLFMRPTSDDAGIERWVLHEFEAAGLAVVSGARFTQILAKSHKRLLTPKGNTCNINPPFPKFNFVHADTL
jgi:hypothetical protein